MWYVLAWSEGRASPYSRVNDTINLGVCLLSGVVILQIPLWIVKPAFRYRVTRRGDEPAPADAERVQFQLKHMLLGTTVLAIALSPIRYILPKDGLQGYRPEWELFVFLAIGICGNLIATLPCLWGGFVSTGRAVVWGFVWLVYGLLVTGLEFVILIAIVRGQGDEFLLYYIMNVTQWVVVFAVMRCYRAIGYRMLRAPRNMPMPDRQNEAGEASPVETKADSNLPEADIE
jgi:hypothetical protein